MIISIYRLFFCIVSRGAHAGLWGAGRRTGAPQKAYGTLPHALILATFQTSWFYEIFTLFFLRFFFVTHRRHPIYVPKRVLSGHDFRFPVSSSISLFNPNNFLGMCLHFFYFRRRALHKKKTSKRIPCKEITGQVPTYFFHAYNISVYIYIHICRPEEIFIIIFLRCFISVLIYMWSQDGFIIWR